MSYVEIGIIGALEDEISTLVGQLEERSERVVSGIRFFEGCICGKRVAIARCGVGKVFAALCTEAMILNFSPKLIVNTGVGGGLKRGIAVGDIVIAEKLVQHDMDTSPLGDPKGLISGINRVYFDTDKRAVKILSDAAEQLSLSAKPGIIASGDKFIATEFDKRSIADSFDASVCEMEGAAVAHVAYVNETPFIVIRAISDSADEGSSMDYMKFLPLAAERSSKLTLALIENY